MTKPPHADSRVAVTISAATTGGWPAAITVRQVRQSVFYLRRGHGMIAALGNQREAVGA